MSLVCLDQKDATIFELLVNEKFVADYMNTCLKLPPKLYDDSIFKINSNLHFIIGKLGV